MFCALSEKSIKSLTNKPCVDAVDTTTLFLSAFPVTTLSKFVFRL